MNRHDFLSSLPFLHPFDVFNEYYEDFSRREPYSSKYDNVQVNEFSKFIQQYYEHFIDDAFMIFSGNSCFTDDRDELHFFFKTARDDDEQSSLESKFEDPGQLKTKFILIKAYPVNCTKSAEKYLFGESILRYDIPPPIEKKGKKQESSKPATIQATTEKEIEHVKALENRGFVTYNNSTKLYELIKLYFVIALIDGKCYLYDHTEIEKITKPILSITKSDQPIPSSSPKSTSASDAELLRDVELFLKNKEKEKGIITNNTTTSEIHNTNNVGEDNINIPYLGLSSCYTTIRLYHIIELFEVHRSGDKISSREEKLEGCYQDLNACMTMMLKHLKPYNMGFFINLVFGDYTKDVMNHDNGDETVKATTTTTTTIGMDSSTNSMDCLKNSVYSKWNNLDMFLHSAKTHPVLLSTSNLKTSSPNNIPTQDLEICYNGLTNLIHQYHSSLMPISSTSTDQSLKKLKQQETDHKMKIEEMCKQFNNDSSLTNSQMLIDLDEEISNMRATQELLILSNCVLNKNFSL